MNRRLVIIGVSAAILLGGGSVVALNHDTAPKATEHSKFVFQGDTPETTTTPAESPATAQTQTSTTTDTSTNAPSETTTPAAVATLTADQKVLQDTGSDVQVGCFDQIMTYRYGDALTPEQALQKVTDIEDAQYASFCQALQQVKQFPRLSTQPLDGFKP